MPARYPALAAVRIAAITLTALVLLCAPRGAGATVCDTLLEKDLYLPPDIEAAALLAGCREAWSPVLARGVTLLAAGQAEAARGEIEKAHSLAPESPWANVYLSMAALRSGDTPNAVIAAERAVELRPNSPAAYAQLGEALLVAGDHDKALAAFRMAIALAPGRARGQLDFGRAAVSSGQPELAVIALERALEIDPQCHEAHFLLAKAQMNAGDVRTGCMTLMEYVRLAEGNADEADRIARARELLARFAERG